MEIDNKQRNREIKISRTLSSILRHNAIQLGFDIDPAGFIKLNDIIAFLIGRGWKNIDEQTIRSAVENNKKRYEIQQKEGVLFIRATQGHSIKEIESQQLLTKIEDPTLFPFVVHGTYIKFWDLIKEQGLKSMTRNHIHFAPGMPKDNGVISGMRSSCDIYIEIDMFAAMKDGIDFFISSNNVILTEGVNGVLDSKYFKSVIKKDGGEIL